MYRAKKKKCTKLQSESDVDKFPTNIFCSFIVLLFSITVSWYWIRSAQLDESYSFIINSNYHIKSMAWYFLINVSIYCKSLGILDFHSQWLLSKIASSSPLESLSMVSLPCRRLTPGERACLAKWSWELCQR